MPEPNSALLHFAIKPAGMHCAVNRDGVITNATGCWQRVLGTPIAELVGSRILDWIHPEELSRAEETLRSLLSPAASSVHKHSLRSRMRRSDGSHAQLYWSAAALPDRGAVLLSAREPTPIETELHLAKTLIDALPLHVTMESSDGSFIYANHEGNTSVNKDNAVEMRKRTQGSGVLSNSQRIVNELHQNGAWAGEDIAYGADGTPYPVHRTLVQLEPGDERPNAIACIERDIRELKYDRILAKQLQLLVATTSDFIASAMFDGRTTYVNPAGMALLGRSGESFETLRLSDILAPEARNFFVRHVFPKVRAGGLWEGDTEFLRADGSAVAVSLVVLVTRDRRGQPMGYGTIAKDLHVRRALEESLRRTLQSLSHPILQLSDEILALPVIGRVDDARALQMTEALLRAIVEKKCRRIVVDFTGAELSDTHFGRLFERIFSPARWLGATTWVSGISPRMARHIGALGDAHAFQAHATLKDALAEARRSQNNK